MAKVALLIGVSEYEPGQDLSIYTRFLIEGIKSGEADRDQDKNKVDQIIN